MIARVEHHGGYQVSEPLQVHSLEILIGEVDLELAVQPPQEADQSISIHFEHIGDKFFDLTWDHDLPHFHDGTVPT